MATPKTTKSTLLVVVRDSEVQYQEPPDQKPFAAYRIACEEDGHKWETCRRWNDLKVAFEGLQRDHPTELNECRDRIPRFDAHAWRWGSSMLEQSFLESRCKAMQDLVQALVSELQVSVVHKMGPAAIRGFLEEGGLPGVAPTPVRRMLNGAPLVPQTPEKEERAADVAEPSEPVATEAEPVKEAEPDKEATPIAAAQPSAEASADAAEAEETEDDEVEEGDEDGEDGDGAQVASAVEELRSSKQAGDSSVSSLAVLLWSSVILLPVVAVIAKEAFGVSARP